MDLLSVRGLTRRFGQLVVLEDVSFDLAAGRLAVVVGPNGSGKTTLLRCVVGVDRPDAGEVLVNGRRRYETDPEMRALLAAALDDIDFFPDLSVSEHLELVAYAHGGSGRAVAEVITELGLDRARDQLPSTLSSGQRRRLALASCFVRPRRLLVLDEPEQRLDARGREWLADRLLREKAEGMAVLMATHDAELAATVADDRLEIGVGA
ncbi:heme ABC exporter ATP-binding protein CcmA [Micromonospora sp. WMMA2032]|uniref:heme ABC exporter ATP-binding protein CcmA n=1 Tax=Micromonospora sp. WMMA2032 TaxID=2039870 RepID=UPI000C058D48|nr:heme ABC exporter ATP-binding protein CcmA [Micromonospora sp. WMMA2032]ATO15239.1 heme ABC exporter ATP-binding protein CcmA [Micromonospora sp. WMMA2032]